MSPYTEVKSGESQLLDVRSPEEWEAGHAEHAIHVPLHMLLLGAPNSLSPKKKVYVYCEGGGRAQMATAYLCQRGFDAVSVGGLNNWQQAAGH